MMGSDARDLMGLPSGNDASRPVLAKQSKTKIRGPSGMAREVLDLNFEGAPPISIVAPRFKEKPKIPFKPRRWEQSPFANSARTDGLILHHWKRAGEVVVPNLPVTPADSHAASEMDIDEGSRNVATPTNPVTTAIDDSRAAKWNVRISRPEYTDDEYEALLRDDDWSREETDYLVDLVIDFDLRWIIIGDRYDYQTILNASVSKATLDENAMRMEIDSAPPVPLAKERSLEDLKTRYYTVAARALALRTPLASMSSAEFDIHEKMSKFDPVRETKRKRYVDRLLDRTQEEAHEEELLLRELSRIVLNQEKFYQERKALYDRLQAPHPLNPQAAHAASTIYSTSQGLQQLMQSMVASQRQKDSERKDKRRSLEAAAASDPSGTHADSLTGTKTHLGAHRNTASQQGQDSRQALSVAHLRQLPVSEQARFGLAWPQERLVSGVHFRHERVIKASQAKSTVQTTRISDALSELGIPPRLYMPTATVVAEYEKLVEAVKQLIEVRRLREKVDGEVRVWEAQRKMATAADEVKPSATPTLPEASTDVDVTPKVDPLPVESQVSET